MKYLILISIILLTCSCQDDDVFLDWQGDLVGSANALKNGLPWDAHIHASAKNPDTIFFGLVNFTDKGFRKADLTFYAIPCIEDSINLVKYQIDYLDPSPEIKNSSVKFSTSLDDGHVSGDRYMLLEGEESNHFEISNLNKSGSIIGKFSLSFLFDDSLGPKKDFSEPDTVIFTNGEFEFRIE